MQHQGYWLYLIFISNKSEKPLHSAYLLQWQEVRDFLQLFWAVYWTKWTLSSVPNGTIMSMPTDLIENQRLQILKHSPTWVMNFIVKQEVMMTYFVFSQFVSLVTDEVYQILTGFMFQLLDRIKLL